MLTLLCTVLTHLDEGLFKGHPTTPKFHQATADAKGVGSYNWVRRRTGQSNDLFCSVFVLLLLYVERVSVDLLMQ
jgi:hypothetical protein